MGKEIRIYVACLAACDNGKSHGVWVDVCSGVDGIEVQMAEMLAPSPEADAEEWAIPDYEGFEIVYELACFISEQGEVAAELSSHFSDVAEAQKAMKYCCAGCCRSVVGFAEELTEDSVQIPASLAQYIDYNAMAYDVEVGWDIFTIEVGFEEVHIFWKH